jgi:hypothetical protein
MWYRNNCIKKVTFVSIKRERKIFKSNILIEILAIRLHTANREISAAINRIWMAIFECILMSST